MDVSEKELKFSDKIVLKNASFSYQKMIDLILKT